MVYVEEPMVYELPITQQTNSMIDFVFAPGMTNNQMLGFEIAGAIWSSYFEDPIDVDIYVESLNLGGGIAGGALPGFIQDTAYNTIQALEGTGVNTVSFLGNGQNTVDITNINMTMANYLAMNDSSVEDNLLEGYIAMNNHNSVNWSYDFSDRIGDVGKIDYLSVALHEIGHVLGFVSGVDAPNVVFQQEEALKLSIKNVVNQFPDIIPPALGTTKEAIMADSENMSIAELYDLLNQLDAVPGVSQTDFDNQLVALPEAYNYATTLDLFRYSDIGVRDLTHSNTYFSTDNGQTEIADFANGLSFQGSHWKQSMANPLGIMDPLIAPGVTREITAVDLQAFQAMGYDIRADIIADGVITNIQMDFGGTFTQAVTQETANFNPVIEDRSAELEDMFGDTENMYWQHNPNNPNCTCPSCSWGGGGYWQKMYWSTLGETSLSDVINQNSGDAITEELPSDDINSHNLNAFVYIQDLLSQFENQGSEELQTLYSQVNSIVESLYLTVETSSSNSSPEEEQPENTGENVDLELLKRAYGNEIDWLLFDDLFANT